MAKEADKLAERYLEFDKLSNIWDGLYRDIATSMGFSDSAFQILFALAQLGEGCLQRDICSTVFLSKQTVGSSIHKLEKEGILFLEPAEKGRGTRVFLTEKGKLIVDERVRPVYEADLEVFASFGPEATEQFIAAWREYMRRLGEAFEKLKASHKSLEDARLA